MEEKNSHTVPEFERRKREERERERERTKNVTYNDHTIRLLTISLSRTKRTIIGRSQKTLSLLLSFSKVGKRN